MFQRKTHYIRTSPTSTRDCTHLFKCICYQYLPLLYLTSSPKPHVACSVSKVHTPLEFLYLFSHWHHLRFGPSFSLCSGRWLLKIISQLISSLPVFFALVYFVPWMFFLWATMLVIYLFAWVCEVKNRVCFSPRLVIIYFFPMKI